MKKNKWTIYLGSRYADGDKLDFYEHELYGEDECMQVRIGKNIIGYAHDTMDEFVKDYLGQI